MITTGRPNRKKQREKIKERQEKWSKELPQQEPGHPVYEHVSWTIADLDKLRKANTLSDDKICKLSVESRCLYGLNRFRLFYGLIFVLLLVFAPIFAMGLPFVSTFIVALLFIVAELFCCAGAFWFGIPFAFNSMLISKYSSLYPHKKRKYTIEQGYLVVCEKMSDDAEDDKDEDYGINEDYCYLVFYQNAAGEVKWAFVNKANYEVMSQAKSNLPLTIVNIESMWPHKTDFAYIQSLFSFANEPSLKEI